MTARFQTFGEFLRDARERRGLSLRQMAKVLTTDHALLYRIETGEKHVSIKQAADWARYLGEERAPWVRAEHDDAAFEVAIALAREFAASVHELATPTGIEGGEAS